MTVPPPATFTSGLRFDRLDALRGLAIVWMAVFHFSFDLNHFGLLQPRQNFYTDAFWTGQRTAIVSMFLFCAGLGQAVALHAPQGWPRFWRRWAQVALCALAVSAGSALMFPRSWISFGVLHGMAVMLVLARLAAPLRAGLWPLGALLLALPQWLQHPFFDQRATNWVGLVTHKPVTEDFVPVLPWLGVMLWGLAAGQWLLSHRPGVLAGALPQALAPLARLGRWSLSFYMLHQPLLIALIVLAMQVLH
ncbi:putative membrane protein [Burkholderiales bacterium JOSHI_001]|nr:putative membrane protein [Burkholderiales bacterium JOSHI_001]